MKKKLNIIAIAFFIIGCSDDSSISNSYSVISQDGFRISTCKNFNGMVARKDAEAYESMSNAIMQNIMLNCEVNSCDDPCKLTIPDVNDYCEVDASIKYELISDTLFISYDKVNSVSKCMCYSDHYFEIDRKFSGANYISFQNRLYSRGISINKAFLGCSN